MSEKATDNDRRPSSAIEPLSKLDVSLIANFTHQVINPLNGVIGTIDNLIDGTVPAERHPQKLKSLHAQLVYAIELLRNLAYLAQLSTNEGQAALRKSAETLVVEKVAIDSAQFFQEYAKSRRLTIHVDSPHHQHEIRASAALIQQVFVNLLENAVKYSSPDTKIVVSCRPNKHSGRLMVIVSNVGVGFDFSEKESLFGLGFRGVAAKRTTASGAGLGLYICRQILEQYGATIRGEHSPKLERTQFIMEFPSFERLPDLKIGIHRNSTQG